MATISNDMLINGQLRSKASGGTLELIEPATEQVWQKVPAAGKKEIDEALEAAAKAFRTSSWSSANPKQRIEALYKIAGLIREHAEQMAILEARNVGKPISDARWEINAGARCFEYYAGAISHFYGKTIPVANDVLTTRCVCRWEWSPALYRGTSRF
ncbi:MAG: aldehyde dehydrogenase family protein [Sedimentisphaerales bacterium]|nr:aldehyde dehydrogenase family protein [Sedimentisphaerales bacterium]